MKGKAIICLVDKKRVCAREAAGETEKIRHSEEDGLQIGFVCVYNVLSVESGLIVCSE